MNVREMTNEQLEADYENYSEMIDNECHSVRDVKWLYAVENEIARRGGDFYTTRTAKISADMEKCTCGQMINREDDDFEQCATCGLMFHEGHEHKCEDTKIEDNKGWCCELCGGLIKGKVMINNGYVIHEWGNCSEEDD